MQNTYVRGALAALRGRPRDECPYRREAATTWRTSYRIAWLSGWASVREPEEDE